MNCIFDYILLNELQPLQCNADVIVDAIVDEDDNVDEVDEVDEVDDDVDEKTMVNEGMVWLMLDEFDALIIIDGTMIVLSNGEQISV